MSCSLRIGTRPTICPSHRPIPESSPTIPSCSLTAPRSCGPTIASGSPTAPNFTRTYTSPRQRSCCARASIGQIDSYSTFYENDRKTPTGLIGYLRERGFDRVFLAGLAFDFCVRYSAEDAYREGFEVVVVEDACRGIDVDGSMAATRESFRTLGIVCTTAEAVG